MMTSFIYVYLAVMCGAVVTIAESPPEIPLPEPTTDMPAKICELPKVVGPCLASIPRYFYNASSGACEEFIYGGCMGNENNFGSKEECVSSCSPKCLEPPVKGNISCEAYVPSYTFNATSGRCEPYVYGGCGATGNVFPDYQECTRVCGSDCDLEPETGDCDDSIPSYFYNSTSERCEYFTYGGCGGNANRFALRRWCIGKCARHCYMDPDAGPCKAADPRYYYNFITRQCQKFIYGGCEGNDNNFEEKNDCQEQCGNSCKQDPEPGPCDAAIPRFFYNDTSEACESFTYGGCEGNSNNFETEKECNSTCVSGYPGPFILN